MALESETPDQAGRDFVAPNDAQPIEDPAQAESIARFGDVKHRHDMAAEYRGKAASARELGDESEAKSHDAQAETYERLAHRAEHEAEVVTAARESARSLVGPELDGKVQQTASEYQKTTTELRELAATKGDGGG